MKQSTHIGSTLTSARTAARIRIGTPVLRPGLPSMVAALRGHFPSAHSGSSWLKHDATKASDQARGLPTRPRQPSRRHVGTDVSVAGGAARRISTPPEAACGSAISGILRHITTLLDTYDRSTHHFNKIGTPRDACQLQGVQQQHLLCTLHRPDLPRRSSERLP